MTCVGTIRLEALTEARMLGEIRKLCDQLGLRMYHARDSRGSEPGFPDLHIVGPRGVIYRELKPQQGELRWHQRQYFRDLRRAKQSCEIWRPGDWATGRIQRELESLTLPEVTQIALFSDQAAA